MGVLTSIGSLIGVFIMSMAVLSPCPLLVNETSGAIIIVSIGDQLLVYILYKKRIFLIYIIVSFLYI